MEDFILKLIDWFDVIDHLPYKMGRIVVDTKIITRKNLKYFLPVCRCGHQVLSAWPLICTKEHRAVLDCYFYTLLFCQFDDWRPYLFYDFKILFYCLGLVTANKTCNHVDAKFCTCFNQSHQMVNGCLTFLQIRVQSIRIISKRRNLYVLFCCII